ncbi:hypothetical protein Bbelb_351120 [Branchiostoma belcheri]|nr:hypothetical protein Bbelb_351120 [Branchiostoma belcheri]
MAQQKHQQEDISVEDVNVTRQVYVPASVLDQLRSQGDFAKRVKALLMTVFTVDEIINNNTMGSDGLGQLDASRLSALREQLAAMTPGEHVNPHGAAYMKKVHRIINARCRKIRRNRVYRAIGGLLTYGPRRGPPGTYYIDDQDLLDIVRDTYPSGEDVNWMLTNQDNRPTKEVGVEDLFEMLEILVFRIVIENTWDTVQAPVALGDPHLGVLIYPGQLIDAELVRDGASASGYHRRLMDFYFCFYGFPSPATFHKKTILSSFARSEGKISYIPVWSHSVVAARTTRTLAMAAPVPVLRGDVTLVGFSLMEVWKKEDEDAAAEREEYREEWAMFEEDMAYLAHLERIMDAEDSSKDEVEEARRLYDQHVQIQFTRKRNIICPVVTDARCRASLESSVVSRDELQVSAELIVSQDRCFASTHVLYVEESLDRTNTGVSMTLSEKEEHVLDTFGMEQSVARVVIATTALSMGINVPDVTYVVMYGAADNMKDLFQQLGRAGRAMNQLVFSACPKLDHRTPLEGLDLRTPPERLDLRTPPEGLDVRTTPGVNRKETDVVGTDLIPASLTRRVSVSPSVGLRPSKKRRRGTAASSYILTDAVRAMDRRQYLKAFRTILNHDAAMRETPTGRIRTLRDTLVDGLRDDAVMRQLKRETIHYTYSPHHIHYPIPIHPHNPFPTHPFPSYPYHSHNPPPPFLPSTLHLKLSIA